VSRPWKELLKPGVRSAGLLVWNTATHGEFDAQPGLSLTPWLGSASSYPPRLVMRRAAGAPVTLAMAGASPGRRTASPPRYHIRIHVREFLVSCSLQKKGTPRTGAGTNSIDAALVGTARQRSYLAALLEETLVEKPGVRPGFFFLEH
jgi:hypothetical protein